MAKICKYAYCPADFSNYKYEGESLLKVHYLTEHLYEHVTGKLEKKNVSTKILTEPVEGTKVATKNHLSEAEEILNQHDQSLQISNTSLRLITLISTLKQNEDSNNSDREIERKRKHADSRRTTESQERESSFNPIGQYRGTTTVSSVKPSLSKWFSKTGQFCKQNDIIKRPRIAFSLKKL